MKKLSLVFSFLLFSFIFSFAQNHKADSLKIALNNAKQDTERINTLIRFSSALENTNVDSALLLSTEALKLAKLIKWQKGIAGADYDIGIYLDAKGESEKAIAYEDSAAAIFQENNLTAKLASVYNVLANIISEQSQYSKALDYYFKALAIDSVISKGSLGDIYNNIGLVYSDQGNYIRAEECYFKALNIYNEKGDKGGIASTLSNLGNIYYIQGDFTKALKEHLKALKIDQDEGKDDNVSLDYSNIGNCYMELQQFSKAIDFTLRSVELGKKTGSVSNLSNSIGNVGLIFIRLYAIDSTLQEFDYTVNNNTFRIKRNALLDSAMVYEQKAKTIAEITNNKMSRVYTFKAIGDIFSLQKKNDLAISFYEHAIQLADSLGLAKEKMENSLAVAHSLMKKGDYRGATRYFDNVLVLKDTLFSQEKEKQSGKLEAQFEYDKKTLEQDKEREKEEALVAEHDKRQKLVTVGISIGLVIVLVFLFLLFRRFKITNKQKHIIEAQKKDVDAAYGKLNDAHEQLQEKDKDITDSIAYARKIQNAILPSEESLKNSLREYFVLYKPRDVVSGDFYWCHREGNKTIFAVVDCTGHGVPGAFMSMIGNSMLNQVVIENNMNNDPAEILNQVRNNLLRQLQQKGQESVSRDGMDMAICIWDRSANTLKYAGANNSLYIVRNGIAGSTSENPKFRPHGNDMVEILPDKQPIGYQEGKMELSFTAQTIQLKKNDCVYIASDGYQDQFGGERNKKFTSRALRDMLVSVNSLPMKEQKRVLESTIEKWKSTYAQTDDICVMGLKIV